MASSSGTSPGFHMASSSGTSPGFHMASSSGTSPVLDETCKCLSLSAVITKKDFEIVKQFLNQRQYTPTGWIDPFDTPSRTECSCGELEIVKEFLNGTLISDAQMASLKLDIAAGNGDLKIVEGLCPNNNPSRFGLAMPIVRASNAGHGDVTRYLLGLTNIDSLIVVDDKYWATCLFLDAIFYGFLDIALTINGKDSSLAVQKHDLHISTPLRSLALKPDLFRSHCDFGFWQGLIYSCIYINLDSETRKKPNRDPSLCCMAFQGLLKWFGITEIRELKARHYNAKKLLKIICAKTKEMVKDENWKDTVYKALLEAVKNGNKDFFIEIVKSNPQLLWISEPPSGQNLFHLAVKYRKESIFNLIHGLDYKKVTLLRSYDNENNNILHMAAYLSPTNDHLSKISGAALKMQRESHWFKEVNSLVSEREVVQKNSEGKTPRRVFEDNHEPLRKEGEEWMKYTATACSLVAALIATVTFQAIFTVPGGNDETSGKPILLNDFHFTAFIIANTLAFFASCISVLIFLSILTSRYSFDDFIVSLPRKMILGLTILFISIASMLVAFITALSASMRERPTLVVPMKPLASIPALIFLMLQYPLLKEMISSTYGKGIFKRHTKTWL